MSSALGEGTPGRVDGSPGLGEAIGETALFGLSHRLAGPGAGRTGGCERRVPQRSGKRLREIPRIDRLGHQFIDACDSGFLLQNRSPIAGDEDETDIGPELAQAARELRTHHLGHDLIGDKVFTLLQPAGRR